MSIPCGRRYLNPRMELVADDQVECGPRRIGRSVLLYGRKNTRFPFQCFVGPDWPCMLVTYTLMIVPSVLFMHNIGPYYSPVVTAICTLLLVTALTFFSLTACSDPGIVFLDPPDKATEALEDGKKKETYECGICNIQRPMNAYHCRDCGFCVVELDHHCPWTGKCIGEKTIKTFYGFLASLAVLIVYVVAFVVATAVQHLPLADFTPK